MTIKLRPSLIVPWYSRYEKLVQWFTLVFVVSGGLLHYFLIDRPNVKSVEVAEQLTQQLIAESKRNQILLEQRLSEAKANTDALTASLAQMRIQVDLARATIDQINDPTRKASDKLTLSKQRADQVRATDELVESLRPNLQISLNPKALSTEYYISFQFTLKNATSRAIVVNEPTISVSVDPNPDLVGAQKLPRQPRPDELKTTICKAGLINSGDAFPCLVTVRSNVPTGGIRTLSYSARFEGRTDVPKDSQTWRMIAAEYPFSYFEQKLTHSLTMEGQILL